MSKARAPKPLPGKTGIRKAYDKAKRKYKEDLSIMMTFEEETPREYNKTSASSQEEKLMAVVKTASKKWQALDRARDDLIDEIDDENLEGIEEPDWYEENNVELKASRSKDICRVLSKLFTEEDDDNITKELPQFGALLKWSERKGLKDDVGTTLSSIEVNKEALQNFKSKLANQKVDDWVEDSQCQLFTGIDKAKYKDFLQLFKKTNKLDEDVMAALEIVEFGKGADNKIKSFRCENSQLTGRYGLYCVVPTQLEKDDVERVDVAYSVFNFSTKLMGIEENKDHRGKKAGVKITNSNHFGKQKSSIREIGYQLSVGDVDAISENFIIWKALSGFANAGVIPKVKYEEDNPNYKKDPLKYSEPTITEVP